MSRKTGRGSNRAVTLREVLHYNPLTGVFTWTKGDRRGKVAGSRHDDRGHLKVAIDNERHLLARLAWLWMNGLHAQYPVEHVNGDRSDNRWSNLRLGTGSLKGANRPPFPHPTPFRGVYRVGDRFEALVPVACEVLNIGSFASAEAARDAIDEVMRNALAKRRERARQVA